MVPLYCIFQIVYINGMNPQFKYCVNNVQCTACFGMKGQDNKIMI